MIRKFLSTVSLSLCLIWPAALAAADQTACDGAGPGALFCAGEDFSRLDDGSTEGLSYWLYRGGFMSKVLVQEVGAGGLSQGDIEDRIIAMVSAQATSQGRDFTFSDIEAAEVGGQPFGTLSYALSREGGNQAILHSYVATRGLVMQIISQIGLNTASRSKVDLQTAHTAALRALTLVATDPEA